MSVERTFVIWERKYRLKVIESKEEGVKLQRGYLHVFVEADPVNCETQKETLTYMV